MKRINVLASKPYDIIIEADALIKAGEYIKEIYNGKKIFILTDERVANIYLARLYQGLENYIVSDVVIEGYEKAKSIESYTDVVSKLIAKGLRRGDLLVAFGGGVIGDLCGFVAATLYRGIDFVQIPTTILAQNDSSIGGKTAINIKEGKNLIGAFNQPKMVIIDPNTINTLPQFEIACGMGEVIKHALIGDRKLVDMIINDASYEEILFNSILVKKKIVEKDEFDTGLRMFLNFGHTFGHAIEKEGNYSKYSHGEAVSYGMLMALRLGEYYQITDHGIYDLLVEMLKKYQIEDYKFSIKEYLPKVIYDKKNISGVIHFILLKEIGKPIMFDINENDLERIAGELNENLSE